VLGLEWACSGLVALDSDACASTHAPTQHDIGVHFY
jgi:hypothetical protein